MATFSIVTATLNRRDLLRRALASVERQNFDRIQHIIVDGGSDDGTLDMLAGQPHLHVTSEPDRNLYDGWNKGIAQATNDFVIILNSDDELPDGALSAASDLADENPEANMLTGCTVISRNAGSEQENNIRMNSSAMLDLSLQNITAGLPLTNARYLRRDLMNEIGTFDIRYRAISDRDYLLRVWASKPVTAIASRQDFYRYHIHDESLTLNDSAPSASMAREFLRRRSTECARRKTKRRICIKDTAHGTPGRPHI